GTVIHGVPVLGTSEDLPRIAKQYDVEDALITIANAPGKTVRDIALRCKEIGLPAKIIPGIFEIVGGNVNLTRIRNVAIEDLLGREQVVLETDRIARIVTSRTVLVTGAGGSIGSELCRQICKFGPATLLLIERSENALFNIHREIIENHPAVLVVPLVADVCDEQRMRTVFARYKPEVLFHAAAHKHVPMMEWNPGEALKNNVFGTKLVADLASEFGVVEFVMVSTDKAVNPTSVMGATKRLAEIYLQALSQKSSTKFVVVRFGNVLGSAGSVVPIFKEQIARGGPVTVTHPEMKRYFMTIPEACQLVLQAASMGEGGEIFVLDMGEPMRIIDVARDLIRLSGFRPDEDIEIRITGMRPGEKLFEELSLDEEKADRTRHPKIFVGHVAAQDWAEVNLHLEDLRGVIGRDDAATLRAKLADVIPEYQGHNGIAAEPEYRPPVLIHGVRR
ncbi:MAG: polysaccharide biosynthesis protein, partial [Clostridia bacterium]|nr:polysaccharide biosynthesis protein [Deltaproteobacteria bacterium]